MGDEPEKGKLLMNASQHAEPGKAQLERNGGLTGEQPGNDLEGRKRRGKCVFIAAVLKQQSYGKLSKGERGMVRRFLEKVTGASRAQLTRLIAQWMDRRTITRKAPHRPSFVTQYQRADIQLLAATDAAHEDLSGPALRRILRREFIDAVKLNPEDQVAAARY